MKTRGAIREGKEAGRGAGLQGGALRAEDQGGDAQHLPLPPASSRAHTRQTGRRAGEFDRMLLSRAASGSKNVDGRAEAEHTDVPMF